MTTICRGRTGPAVGARGLIGFAQEGCWGRQIMTPDAYVDMLNESVVSEIGSLVSESVRRDRAVHKRIGGVESAGGDVNIELGPNGYGTWMKHSLGLVQSWRVDDAFVLVVTNAGVASAALTITHTNGLATSFEVAITGGSGNFTANLSDATADTIQELMDLINAHGDLAAYSPTSYMAGGTDTTLAADDYSAGGDPSSGLEAYDAVDILSHPDAAWVVCRGWGVYKHVIDAHEELPEGLSLLIGRDVAAFLYAGVKFNTFNITAAPAEILAATFGAMAKGGSTASPPTADSGNTGNQKNAFEIRYTGEAATCTLEVVHGDTLHIDSADNSEDILLNIAEEYVDPDTGRVYPVQTLGGLLEFLKDKDYLEVSIAPYTGWEMPSSWLATAGPTDIKTTSRVDFYFDATDVASAPAVWGDYRGQDQGSPVTFHIRVATGGVPGDGSASVEFSEDGGSTYHNEAVLSASEPTEVRVGAGNTNTGFTVFFPDDTTLNAGDVWSIQTIYEPPTDVAYASDQDPFSGFEGNLTIDGVDQPVMGWNTTLTNDLFGDKYHMGERVRGMLPEQQRTIEGTLTVEFDDLDLYRRFVNGVAAALLVDFKSAVKISDQYQGDSKTEFEMIVSQPNIEFNGATPVIAGMELIQTDMPYVALWDDAGGNPDMTVTLYNDKPYL